MKCLIDQRFFFLSHDSKIFIRTFFYTVKCTIRTEMLRDGLINPSEPVRSKLLAPNETLRRDSISGSVMDGLNMEAAGNHYVVYKYRWVMLCLFVLYSASNSLQWTQYTIIQDIVVRYYGVDSTLVSWTSMVYMITYMPLIFPASWLLDKTVSIFFHYKLTANFGR